MLSRSRTQIPVIDVFAGPGGLGEGFSAYTDHHGDRPFKIAVSIEKEEFARRTLLLRSFYRQFPLGKVPTNYYRRLRGEITTDELFACHHKEHAEAEREAWRAELSSPDVPLDNVRHRVDDQLSSFRDPDHCVLIGGPPCQAYSLAGRSRNKGIDAYVFEKDARTQLYIEYLQLLADFKPAVFVLENVKGLLSSKQDGMGMFERILGDLQDPVRALHREGRSVRGKQHTRYALRPLDQESLFTTADPADYIIQCEKHGIPQARHRIIVVGVREDMDISKLGHLTRTERPATLGDAICDLPRLRSGLSKLEDNTESWKAAARLIVGKGMVQEILKFAGADVAEAVAEAAGRIGRNCINGRGGEFVRGSPSVKTNRDWYVDDDRLGGFCNHATRAHIVSDLHRYLFASAFAQIHNHSPALRDFPPSLRPAHHNIGDALNGSMFADRFRVQLSNRPSTTITSHISKDGHYYIHPDPTQCRSLTVREAARLQTFPDDYFFEGPRTSQYHQVGNAVPPLIANAIAACVLSVLA